MSEIKAPQKVEGVKDCCLLVENLRRVEDRYPWSVDECQVCGCKHTRLRADLGHIGMRPGGQG